MYLVKLHAQKPTSCKMPYISDCRFTTLESKKLPKNILCNKKKINNSWIKPVSTYPVQK